MAIDSYMAFQLYGGPGQGGAFLDAESQVDLKGNSEPLMTTPTNAFTAGKVFEIEDFSFDIEQTLNIGSQSSGAGAGKVTFNPFSITRKIDKASTIFFEMACSGTAFAQVSLGLRKSAGAGGAGAGGVSGLMFLRFDFKLVAVKTISWSHDDESPKEEVTFEYGGLQVRYNQQDPSGAMSGGQAAIFTGGWNRVKNIKDWSAGVIS
jgi:type VI secretion system secreted protein Hcp